MRSTLILLFILGTAALLCAQAGPCTEAAIKGAERMPLADDAFMYMPPYGKPVVGKGEIQGTSQKKFAGRTNIQRSWMDDHRIVSAPSGDMATEYGTLKMSYDENQQRHEFKAVILNVYKAKGSVCQTAAGTMQPLEDDSAH